jgi:hypothetical protein
MSNTSKEIEELTALIEETATSLGATDQTYIGILRMLNKHGKLSLPSRVLRGQLLFFKYKPISESFISSNKYYDAYPLVLVTDAYRGGFEGINLHYIDKDDRMFLFENIMKSMPTMKANEQWRTRISVDYDKLNASKKFRYYKPCYKRYLWDGLKRRPVVIPFEYWKTIVESETSRFAKSRSVTVHREARKSVIRGD